MALLHRATLRPSKLELLNAYLNGAATELIGAYRFDDPAGEVGIETHLVRHSSGSTLHLPLTYRAEQLAGADEWLVGKIEHSALGTRWAYNACADGVYAAELVRTILTGGTEVEQYFEQDGERLYREPTAKVIGSGAAETPVPTIAGVHPEPFEADTLIDTGGVQVVVRHDLSTAEPESFSSSLTGTWSGAETPVVLAYIP